MKGVNLSCSSPASAAVCSSIGRKPMVWPTIVGRAKPKSGPNTKPFTSKSTIMHSDHRASTSTTSTTTSPTSTRTSKSTGDSSADSSRHLLDHVDKPFFDLYPHEFEPSLSKSLLSTSSTRQVQPVKGIGKPFFPSKSYSGSKTWSQSLVPINSPRMVGPSKGDKSSGLAVLRPSSSTRSHHKQVVVLRVSLHCKGCEGKVRKHISKMEGVTSFSIDFATKKVTIVGDITPLGVLDSVSKVKKAQFWSTTLMPPRASASF